MDLKDLEKRVRVLEDIEEIKRLQIRYINSLVLTKWDDLINCFAEDGVIDIHSGTARGKAELSKIFKERVAVYHIGQEGEICIHPIIEVNGDRAKGIWLLYLQFASPRKFNPRLGNCSSDDAPDWQQGFYEAEYVREKGKWKISLLKWRCRLLSPMTLLKDYKP